MAASRLTDMAHRLTMAGHDALLEDRLDGTPPVLELTLRPWRGPLAPQDAIEGTLQIRPGGVDQDTVRVRAACDSPELPWVEEDQIPAPKLTAAWLEARVLSFVGQVLARA